MEQTIKFAYVTPVSEVLTVKTESLICASGNGGAGVNDYTPQDGQLW